MKRSFIIATSLFSLLVPALPITVQAQFSGDGGTDILINAEKATYRGQKTLLEGSVDVRQGEAQILSDIMSIYRAEPKPGMAPSTSNIGEVTRIEAEGNFKYITPDNTVTGNRGIYDKAQEQIIVTGNVVLIQPSGSRVRGNRLVYDVKTKKAQFGNQCVGENCDGGRVNFSIRQD